MAGWDIDPQAAWRVLADTQAAAEGLSAQIYGAQGGRSVSMPDGATDRTVGGLGGAASRATTCAQSALIGVALQDYFTARQTWLDGLRARIEGVIVGTSNAVKAVASGDEAMASAIQSTMTQACLSGDFTELASG